MCEWLGVLTAAERVTRCGERKFPGEEDLAFRHVLLRDRSAPPRPRAARPGTSIG